MTKNAKRNRKKSCSSVEGSGEGGVKVVSASGKEKSRLPVVGEPSKAKTCTDNAIRVWFSGLSNEDSAYASSIEDTAFVTTLLDLASSWSGHPHSASSKDIKATWDKKVSLEEVEQTYKTNLVRAKSLDFAEGKAVKGKEIQSGMQRSTANHLAAPIKAESVGSIPKATMEEEETKAEKGSGIHLDGSCSAPPTVDSDTFRIRGAAAPKTDKGRLEEDNGILDHLRIVYPSVYNIVVSHPAFQHVRQQATSSPEALHNPILLLDNLGDYSADETLRHFDSLLRAADLNETFLSEDRYNNIWRQSSHQAEANSSWIRLLKPMAEKSSNSVTLSLLLAVRMEDSIMEAYNGKHGAGKSDGESGAADAVQAGGGPGQKEKEDTVSTGKTCKPSRISFHVAAEAVKQHASRVPSSRRTRAMDHVVTLVPDQYCAELSGCESSLVLLPFSNVLRCKQVGTREASSTTPLVSWNAALEMALMTLVDDVPTAQPLSKTAFCTQHTQDTLSTSAPGKKNKKKKKKKKRKASIADQSTCSSDLISVSRASLADDSLRESQNKKTDGKLPKSVDTSVADSNGSRIVATITKPSSSTVLEAKLPAKAASSQSAAPSTTDAVVVSGETKEKAAPVAAPPQDNKSLLDTQIKEASHDAQNNKASHDAQDNKASHDSQDSADDQWETVEAKGRGNRNKRAMSGHARNERSHVHYSAISQGSSTAATAGSKKGKKNNRKKNATRKMVRDILSSVLDDVDTEVKRRRSQVARSAGGRTMLPGRAPPATSGPNKGSAWQARPMTMRDVVLGRLRAEAENAANTKALAPARPPVAKKEPVDAASRPAKPEASSGDKPKAPILRNTPKNAWVADERTAPTVPETLSGISAQSSGMTDGDNVSLTGDAFAERVAERNADAVDYSSSGDMAVFASAQENSKSDKKGASPAPPLQTLLGPGNTNSASSSVASSLEVPHGRHLHHHHSSVLDENDVGYHLLDVCDRLSRDMDVFMGRRAVALCVRRRERGALLAALQDTASKLWAGRCHVEMYGSCATQLDLPSSDIDTVICGLDRRPEANVAVPAVQHQTSDDQISAPQRASSEDELSAAPSIASQESQSDSSYHHPYSPGTAQYMHVPALSPNAERVIRLAAELERQPWAVQVKAIPTAKVPVVKILADPSRLPGAVAPVMNGGDWMMQQHHMAQAAAAGMNKAQPVAAAGQPSHPQAGYYVPNNGATHGAHSHYVPHSPPPWRGADVMNGLFSVDITFEGPEHGGIGSTAYSARFVQEACNEVGLPPDRAPVVQALMVLKELLAQRRLNEPFSGGLSSYALLLMVEAVLKERRAIQQEMAKIERQRLVVAAGDSNVSGGGKHLGLCGRESNSVDDSAKNATTSLKNPDTKKAPQPDSTRSPVPEKAPQRGATSAPKNQGSKSGKAATKGQVQAKKVPAKVSTPKVEASKNKDPPTPKIGSSWASIAAKKKTAVPAASKVPPTTAPKVPPQADTNQSKLKPAVKVGTFADAVNNGGKAADPTKIARKASKAEVKKQVSQQQAKKPGQTQSPPVVSPSNASPSAGDAKNTSRPTSADKSDSRSAAAADLGSSGDSSDSNNSSGFGASSLFPQGSNDVLEVLCSGETTAGKLLLHFLLYYGRYFDSHAMVIDNSGKHHPDAHLVGKRGRHNVHLSPYVPRKGGGSIDPVTGMLTVDPIVVYDPLEGAEDSNVARSCFAWSSIRWVFAQSYMTLSSAIERSGTPPATPGNHGDGEAGNREASSSARVDGRSGSGEEPRDTSGEMVSPLLELLLSF